jgi:O-antigen/teichoic acid export membrane protein
VLLTDLVLRLYGSAYAGAAAVPLRLLVLAALPWSVVIIAQAQLRIEHRFSAVTVLTGCLCAASLGLPIGLAQPFGSIGMAGGFLLSVTASAVLAWRLTAGVAR